MTSEENKSLLHVSPILTNKKLSDSLSQWFKETLTFTHWEYVSDATGKGDAYMSELMRIKVYGNTQDGTSKHVQIILKNIPSNLCRRLSFRSDEFFKNEINFYETVLPALLKFQASKNMKDPFVNHPKLFLSHCDGVNDIICLGDASLDNFASAIRQEGIDYAHFKVSMELLAKYHAMSIAMRDQQPEEYGRIRKAIFETYYDERLRDWYGRYWNRLCRIAIDAMEKEYPNTVYAEKIKEFAVPEQYSRCIQACKETFETGVISHGDCWSANFLYKYTESKTPSEAFLLDFQLARCGSPILDVSCFIYSCTTQEMRLKHYDELLKYYHDVMSTQIRDMGSDPDKVYSWDMFMDEVKKYSHVGLAFSFEATPVSVLESEEAMETESESGEKKNIDDILQLPYIKTKEGRLREAGNFIHALEHGYV